MSVRLRYVILGGGLAGLTCADELLRRGHDAVCVEAQREVGGLARNLVVQDHIFDIGGHRFHSDNPEIIAWIQDLLGDELLTVERRSRILLAGRFADYPLRPVNAFFGMGPKKSFEVLAGYLRVAASSRGETDNFEDWVVSRFGRALYDIYFGPYTRKVWGIDPRRISATWAAQRIQLLSLAQAVRKAMFPAPGGPRTLVSSFFYPRNGIGRIAIRIAKRSESRGGRIVTGQAVRGVARDGDGFRVELASGETLRGDRVVSTIPIGLAANMLGIDVSAGALEYRSLRCVQVLLRRPRVTSDTWIYTPDSDIIFARIHEPKNWSPHLVPGDGTSLCLEVFCTEGDELWNMDGEELHRRCVNDLARLGFIDAGEVTHAADLRVRDAYPVFLVGFEHKLAAVTAAIRDSGVELVGRTGAFTYKNMDQVIEDSLDLVRRLTEA
ncbi:MAG: FAD-dependent oxidoreductase [Deltaproteobacteria bacterium]|nr:FAD-dependent oxidoreductase [Deltaproteobacteria bacterium]